MRACTSRSNGLSAPIAQALTDTFDRGEQSLVFLNRRGYAPVVTCESCGWLSKCPHCSTFAVFHKLDRSLRCHHCGYTAPVPRACPTCGNQNLKAVGQGTQRIEETLRALLPAAKIARIDRDSTRKAPRCQKGARCGTCGRGRCARRHADDRERTRFSARFAGRRAQSRWAAGVARLSRTRALVCHIDAGLRTGRSSWTAKPRAGSDTVSPPIRCLPHSRGTTTRSLQKRNSPSAKPRACRRPRIKR